MTLSYAHCFLGAGIALLIRNWTNTGGTESSKYADAANGQLNYLLNVAPRAYNGAISQRAPPEPVQVWADFMSMAPPFIGYYGGLQAEYSPCTVSYTFHQFIDTVFQGAIHNDRGLVEEGYRQIFDYYEILYDSNVGMMEHILLGDSGLQDHKHWATGNGWAVNGMLRVLRIIQLSKFASTMGTEQANLIHWASTVSRVAFLPSGNIVADDENNDDA